MNRSDIPRVAAAVAELGQLLGRQAVIAGHNRPITVAEAALEAARAYQPGQRAGRLEPSHGRRLEEVRWDDDGTLELVEIPNDPVGEAATADDPTLTLPDRWLDLLAELDAKVAAVRQAFDGLIPLQPNSRPGRCSECGAPRLVLRAAAKPQDDAALALDGWCPSCYRDDRYLKPIDTDKRGNRYYSDRCRWCGGFRARHDIDPPLDVVRAHHLGRVSTTLVDRSLRKAKADTPASKRKKKRRK